MPRFDDKTIAVARIYSDSILQIAEQQGEAESLLEELLELRGLIDRDPVLQDFISSPLVDEAKRRDSLEKILRGRASDLLVDSLQVLNRKGRLSILPALVETYRDGLRVLRGQVRVDVRTAVPLTESLRTRLGEAIEKATGKKGLLDETVDDNMIGGIVVRVGDHKFDASVSGRLRKLGEDLLERGSREIEKGTSLKVAVQEG